MEIVAEKQVVLTTDADKVESVREQVSDFIEDIDIFRTICKRYKVPVSDFEEIHDVVKNDTLIESVKKDQLKKHPLHGQVDFDSLKLPEKVANDLEVLEAFQREVDTFNSLRGFITEKAGTLEIDVKAIKDACSVFGSEKAKLALANMTKASELINAIRGKTHYTDLIHDFCNLFTVDSEGQVIANLKFIRGL